MGNAAKMKRKQEREMKDWDKPYTTTKRAIHQLATQEAGRYFEEMKVKLSNEITSGISLSAGYILASTLEAEHGFGKKRSAKSIMKFMEELVNIAEGRCDVEDHIKYWNEKGLKITEEGNKLTVNVL